VKFQVHGEESVNDKKERKGYIYEDYKRKGSDNIPMDSNIETEDDYDIRKYPHPVNYMRNAELSNTDTETDTEDEDGDHYIQIEDQRKGLEKLTTEQKIETRPMETIRKIDEKKAEKNQKNRISDRFRELQANHNPETDANSIEDNLRVSVEEMNIDQEKLWGTNKPKTMLKCLNEMINLTCAIIVTEVVIRER